MASISTNYDPPSTAQALAEAFTASRQQLLKRQNAQAAATAKALDTLKLALSGFQTSLATLTGPKKTMSASSAVFSDTSVGSATAFPTAAAGSYSFFVERLASAHQISYSGLKDFTAGADDTIRISSGTTSFQVELGAGTDWTVRGLAAAINGATGNTSVSASVVTTGTDAEGNVLSELVLTSKLTGEANAIKLTTDGNDVDLKTMFVAPNPLSPADDAVLRVGSIDGTPIRSATNTFSEVIDDVTITVSKAQAAATLTVGLDTAKTTANVQAFVTAYNALWKSVNELLSPGNPATGAAAGEFAGDSGVRALRDQLVSVLRGAGATSLATYGITADKSDGSLVVAGARLTKALAANPTGLDTLIGTASGNAPSGIAGKLDTYLKMWTDVTNGQIGNRKSANTKLKATLTDRQATLDRQYDSAYARYLAQFTHLQSVQNMMSYNTSLFDALFGSKKD